MRSCAALFALAAWLLPLRGEQAGKHAVPSYTQSSIVNAASNLPGGLAPNTIATLYGTGLAVSTRAVAPADLADGRMPTLLPGTGTRVIVGGLTAPVYFASPGQLNFLVPSTLPAGVTKIQVLVDGRAGPAADVFISAASPAFFVFEKNLIAATRADGAVITRENPAIPGDWVVLYATGLGRTNPIPESGSIIRHATPVDEAVGFRVTAAGDEQVPIAYAGLSIGFAGLYQINLRVPEGMSGEVEFRMGTSGGTRSPAGTILPVMKPAVAATRPSR